MAALLYVFQNNIAFYAQENLDAATYQITYQVRYPPLQQILFGSPVNVCPTPPAQNIDYGRIISADSQQECLAAAVVLTFGAHQRCGASAVQQDGKHLRG